MKKFSVAILLFFTSYCLLPAANFTFGYKTPYNAAIYTQDVELYESIEKAMSTDPENVIALKMSASSKNMAEITRFKNLKFLMLDEGFTVGGFYLSGKVLETFFTLCERLPELEYLGIHDAKLMGYVKSPEKLKGLKISKYDGNTFHEKIHDYFNLQVLIIEDKQVTRLSDAIGVLRSLRQLELYTESLAILPEFSYLSDLKVFKANVGKIKKLPSSLTALQTVKFMSLTGLVAFKDFPEELCEMGGLEELRVELRNATSVPKEISKLARLRSLHLIDCNKITALPSTMPDLLELEYVYISGGRHTIQVNALMNLQHNFSIMLVRCNYAAIAEQLQYAPNLQEFIIPSGILPSDLKKVQQFIPQNKIRKENI